MSSHRSSIDLAVIVQLEESEQVGATGAEVDDRPKQPDGSELDRRARGAAAGGQ